MPKTQTTLAMNKLRSLAQTIDGEIHYVSLDVETILYANEKPYETRYRAYINCAIEEFGISAKDSTFELAYLQLKNKIEQHKEKEVKERGNPE